MRKRVLYACGAQVDTAWNRFGPSSQSVRGLGGWFDCQRAEAAPCFDVMSRCLCSFVASLRSVLQNHDASAIGNENGGTASVNPISVGPDPGSIARQLALAQPARPTRSNIALSLVCVRIFVAGPSAFRRAWTVSAFAMSQSLQIVARASRVLRRRVNRSSAATRARVVRAARPWRRLDTGRRAARMAQRASYLYLSGRAVINVGVG